MAQTRARRLPDFRSPFMCAHPKKQGTWGCQARSQISLSDRLVLVLPEKSRKKRPQNRPKLFRMNNFLVIVLDNSIRFITLQKQWGGGRVTQIPDKPLKIINLNEKRGPASFIIPSFWTDKNAIQCGLLGGNGLRGFLGRRQRKQTGAIVKEPGVDIEHELIGVMVGTAVQVPNYMGQHSAAAPAFEPCFDS